MAINVQIKYFNSFWLKKACPQLTTVEEVMSELPSQNPNEHPRGDYLLGIGQWPGLPWTPTYINPITGLPMSYPDFAFYAAYLMAGVPLGVMQAVGTNTAAIGYGSVHWYIEESCIKGGFNNNRLSLGVRAYTVDENPVGQNRNFSLIHSGILNTRSGYNETNVFSVANNIEKDLEQRNGTIEKLYIEDTLLYVFKEAKVNKITEAAKIQHEKLLVLGFV